MITAILDTPLIGEDRAYHPPKQVYATLDDEMLASDPMFGGAGYFAGEVPGIVTVAGKPARRRVLCFDRATLKIARDAWSNPDGTYRLAHLRPARDYLIIALDHEQKYEPVAYDWLRPAVPAAT